MKSLDSRPSPFFLVSATSSAFVLLISAAFSTSAMWRPGIFNMAFGIGHQESFPVATYERCVRAGWASSKGVVSKQCEAIIDGNHVDTRPAALLCFATLVLLSAAQYWLGPAWRIRRRRLRPIDPDMFPELHQELDRTAHQVLTAGRVRFLLDILNPAVDGLAFGRAGRRYIVLSRGMLPLFEQDRTRFRAVILHELAHVRNRDLDITAATLALWRSYFFVILLPNLLAAYNGVVTHHPPVPNEVRLPFVSGSGMSWMFAAQVTGMTGLAWITRYAVLRARELQADARVLAWQPDPTSLRRLFDAVTERRRRSVSVLRRRTHPGLGVRTVALTDTGPLLRQGFAFSFAVGACFSLAMDPATSMTGQLDPEPLHWPVEAFALVLVIALGVRALRAAAYARATGPSGDGLRARLGLTLGLPVGWSLSPSRMTDHELAPFPPSVQLAGLLVLAAAGWLLGLWVEWVAALWEPRVRAADHPARAAVAPIALVALVVLVSARTVFGTQTQMILSHAMHYPPTVSDPMTLVLVVLQMVLDEFFASATWVLTALVLLFGIPMAGLVARRTAGIARGSVPKRPRLDWLLFAVVGGLAAWLADSGSFAINRLKPGYDASAWSTFDTMVAHGAAVGAGLAAAVAFRARTSPLAKGVLAALVGGVLYLARLKLMWLPALPGQLVMFTLARTLEAAVLGGLAGSALSRIRASVWRLADRRHRNIHRPSAPATTPAA